MPLPRWLAQLNKYTFNRREINRGKRPVLAHVGRTSGRRYYTPLDAHPVDGGYVFISNYGPQSDWVQNIVVAGTANLIIDGVELELVNPKLLSREDIASLLPESVKLPNFVSIGLRMEGPPAN